MRYPLPYNLLKPSTVAYAYFPRPWPPSGPTARALAARPVVLPSSTRRGIRDGAPAPELFTEVILLSPLRVGVEARRQAYSAVAALKFPMSV